MGGTAARLPGGRLHLQEGPIDLVIGADGAADPVQRAYAAAVRSFDGLLAGLVSELSVLRAPIGQDPPTATGPVARRMVAAAWPHRAGFVTPMAAVAGAVADHILQAMAATDGLARAFVNNGGDIALHLTAGTAFEVGLVPVLTRPEPAGFVSVAASDPVRGIATSGREGRSFSLGIADSVTVLAANAAAADVAATLIGNAVDLPGHPAVRRGPASAEDPDSDLGDRAVTLGVGPLGIDEVAAALDAGCRRAEAMLGQRLIAGAAICLRGQWRVVGAAAAAGTLTGSRMSRTET